MYIDFVSMLQLVNMVFDCAGNGFNDKSVEPLAELIKVCQDRSLACFAYTEICKLVEGSGVQFKLINTAVRT